MSPRLRRILHVYSGNLYGGIETLLLGLARTPGNLQHEFALCFVGRLRRELEVDEAVVHPLPAVRLSNLVSIVRARSVLRTLLKEHAYDVIVSHSLWIQAVFGPVLNETAPLVFWLHQTADGAAWFLALARRATPSWVICNSDYTRSTLGRVYGKTPATTLYCPVLPTPARRPRSEVRQELGTAAETCVIVQVSRMQDWKGHVFLLQACARLPQHIDWAVWIVGGAQRPSEQDYVDSLVRQAGDLGLASRVSFLGERSDVSSLLAAADIFCQPNARPEPFGIVFIEAMYARLPVVAAKEGGAAEIIVDGECGILVPPRDAAALSAALESLVTNADARGRLGVKGPVRADALCRPEVILRRLEELIETVANPS